MKVKFKQNKLNNTREEFKVLKPIMYFLFASVLIYGIIRVINLIWVCDDIFITFRYADNFIQGKGIVFNEGERVEGYTHFLWFVLLSAFRFFNLDLEQISIWLGIASYLGTIAIFLFISFRTADRKILIIPFTALALSVNYDFAVWATGGLETSFITFLLSLTFYIYFSKLTRIKKHLITGLILTLCLMTRPDAALFYLYANLLLLLSFIYNKTSLRESLKELMLINVSFIVIYIPYFLWRYNYYGDIFPNTYYAKLANESYYEQGFLYIWTFISSYKTSLISLAGIFLIAKYFFQKKPLIDKLKNIFDDKELTAMVILFLSVLIYTIFYVARVGGDFMFARFIIPVLPFIYFTAEVSLKKLLTDYKKGLLIIFLVILVLIYFEKNIRDDNFLKNENGKLVRKSVDETNGISDERLYYMSYWDAFPKSKNLYEGVVTEGKILNPYFKDLDITVVIGGARNYMGYYANFKNIIVDNGLTDKFIAKQQIETRGRIGHEKYATLDYLIKRKTVLGFYDKFRNNTNDKPYCVAYVRLKELGFKNESRNYLL